MGTCPHCGAQRPIGEEDFCPCRSPDQLPVKPMTGTAWLITIPFAVLAVVFYLWLGGFGGLVAFLTIGPDVEGPPPWILAAREVRHQLENPRQAEFPAFFHGSTVNPAIFFREEEAPGELRYRIEATFSGLDEFGRPGRHPFSFTCRLTYQPDPERWTQTACSIDTG